MILFLVLTVFVSLFNLNATLEIPIKQHRVKRDITESTTLSGIGPKFEAPYFNDYLLVDVKIGSPQKTATLMIMSGSTRMWISCKNQLYNESGTLLFLKRDFRTISGTFQGVGDWYADSIEFENGIRIEEQPFGLTGFVVSEWNGLEDNTFPADGFLPLNHFGPVQYKLGEPKAFIDNMLENFYYPIYSLYLGPHQDPKHGPSGGLLTMGNFDYRHCDVKTKRPIQMVPVSGTVVYAVNIKYLNVREYTTVSGILTSVDSSFSYLMFRKSELDKIYEQIGAGYDTETGLNVVSCEKMHQKGHAITVSFETKDTAKIGSFYEIHPKDYIVDLDLPDGKCALTIVENDSTFMGVFYAIFGTPFLRSVCTTFDLKENQMILSRHLPLDQQGGNTTKNDHTTHGSIKQTTSKNEGKIGRNNFATIKFSGVYQTVLFSIVVLLFNVNKRL